MKTMNDKQCDPNIYWEIGKSSVVCDKMNLIIRQVVYIKLFKAFKERQCIDYQ